VRRNSQSFQGLDVWLEPNTERSLIGFCRNLLDFPGQLFDFILMPVTVNVRLPREIISQPFFMATQFVPVFS
jgi:hypothetical protein